MKSEKEVFLELLYTANNVTFYSTDDAEPVNVHQTFGLYVGYPIIGIAWYGEGNYIIHCSDDVLPSSYKDNKEFASFVERCYGQYTDEEINEAVRFHEL